MFMKTNCLPNPIAYGVTAAIKPAHTHENAVYNAVERISV